MRPGILRALRDIDAGHLGLWGSEAIPDRDVAATKGWKQELIDRGLVAYDSRVDRWTVPPAGNEAERTGRAPETRDVR